MTRLVSAVAILLMAPAGAQLFAQDYTPPDQQVWQQQRQQQQAFPPEQLDSLVAPVALYPDPLLSQVLVASTYPQEILAANQWLRQYGGLQGQALVQAAQQQSWDPSVQALVPFQDVIRRLASDINWTTDLGNAFLAQQGDVMNAVQRMRQRARDNGRLTDTQQQRVIVDDQNGQQAIEIEPTDQQVVYVPNYNPSYFWGQPDYYPYPDLYYPGGGYGWGWGFGVRIGSFFGGFGGWRNWGWCPGWYNHTILVNNGFFNRYNYRGYNWGYNNYGYRGSTVWAHDPGHRGAIPYANRGVAQRFAGGNNYQQRSFQQGNFQQGNFQQRNFQQSGRQNFAGGGNSYQPRQQQYTAPNQYRSTPSQGYQGRSFQGQQNYRGNGNSNSNGYQPRNEMRTPRQSVAPNQYRSAPPAQSFRGGGNSYQAPRSYSAPSAPRGGGGGGGFHPNSGGGGHRR